MIILLYILHLQVKIQIIYIMLRQLLLLLLTVCYTLLCGMSSKVPQQQLWNDVKLHWSSCYLVFPAFWEFATRFVPRDLPSLESFSLMKTLRVTFWNLGSKVFKHWTLSIKSLFSWNEIETREQKSLLRMNVIMPDCLSSQDSGICIHAYEYFWFRYFYLKVLSLKWRQKQQ